MSYLSNFHCQFLGPETKPKLVFLHGLMGYANNWRRIARAFEDDFHVLTYDQRGHGQSFRPYPTLKSGYRPEDYANDLLFILDELGWQKIYLVGHSMGGRNAHHFAFCYPERVEKLVIEDIGPDANPESIQKIEKILLSAPAPFASRKEAEVYFMDTYPDKVFAQYLFSNITEQNGVYDWRFFKEGILESVRRGREWDRWEELQGLKVPTLVIRGSKTDELSEAVYKKMLSSNPLIQGVQIENAGHWVHFEKPEEFIKVLSKFLKLA